MKPYQGLVFTLGKYKFKVTKIDEMEVHCVRLNSDESESGKVKSFSLSQWPPIGASFDNEETKDADAKKGVDGRTNDLGEAPELPPIFFAYDPVTKKFEVKDRRGNVITGFDIMTVNGKDGDSAYQLWKNGQKPGTDVSFEAFLNAFRGAKGEMGIQGPAGPQGEQGDIWMPIISTDGENLYFRNSKGEETNRFPIKGAKGDQGLQGVQGPIGPKGDKGEAWMPVVTNDGCFLYFRNADGEETERFPIKGVKGDQGIQGARGLQGETGPVYTPRINSDGTLSWTNNGDNLPNPTPINIKGERGDKGEEGVTFQPIVKDGVIYWTNNQGKDNPDPVRIAGPQGDRGDVGRTGLSAYQIWLKTGNLGTEQDFLDSLKGERGEPFDPSKIVEFKVEDYTCPIQEINTRLIVDKNESCEDADTIIDKRIDKIAQLREEGQQKAKGWKYWINPVNLLKEFTWMCAGADRPLLRMCPGDHSKYVGIGTVILFTALMAWFSSFIAMQLVFGVEKNPDMNVYAIIFATFWSAMIFCLDRFITNTMYSDGKVSISKQEFFSGLPRIVIAIFLGIIISAPLELKIFEKAIEQKQEEIAYNESNSRRRDSEAQAIDDANSKKKNQNDDITLQEQLRNNEIAALTKPENPIISEGNPNNTRRESWDIYESDAAFNARYSQYLIELKEYNEGIRTTAPTEPKTKRVVGTEYVNVPAPISPTYKYSENEYRNMLLEYDSKVEEINQKYQTKINELTLELDSYDNEAQKNIEADSLRIANIESARDDALLSQLSILHDLAMDGYKPFNNKDENTWLDYITLHPLWYYLLFSPIGLIMLLFILIDISPVLYKMMLADGKYDNYMHQDKLLAQDKIRLSLAKMLKHLNDSELKRVAPFVMGDIYEKMAGDSFIYKTEEEYQNEHLAQKPIHWAWRIWPLSMLRWIFWKEEEKPSAPVIVMEDKRVSKNEETLREVNDKVFDEVLDMKKRLILASYRRWYKTQYYQLDPNGDDGIVPPPDNFPENADDSTDSGSDVINIPPTGGASTSTNEEEEITINDSPSDSENEQDRASYEHEINEDESTEETTDKTEGNDSSFDNSQYEREVEEDEEEINPNNYNM